MRDVRYRAEEEPLSTAIMAGQGNQGDPLIEIANPNAKQAFCIASISAVIHPLTITSPLLLIQRIA